jgi:hypothetical protein|tara:strand:- start:88 stop:474 length:387 start_codon:yes stop_codon:yes gene_type:complete
MRLVLNHLSLGIVLDDVVKDIDFEKQVLENIRFCRKTLGKLFKVVFLNKELSEDEVKEFFKRNKKTLFEINTKITKDEKIVWFVIGDFGENTKYRYNYRGTILKGIVEYKNIVNTLMKKENDESSHSR